MALSSSPLGGSGGLGLGSVGLMTHQMEETQERFAALSRKMESESKIASTRAESQATASSGTGVFSPAQGYDHSAVGAWAQENQSYVMEPGLNTKF